MIISEISDEQATGHRVQWQAASSKLTDHALPTSITMERDADGFITGPTPGLWSLTVSYNASLTAS